MASLKSEGLLRNYHLTDPVCRINCWIHPLTNNNRLERNNVGERMSEFMSFLAAFTLPVKVTQISLSSHGFLFEGLDAVDETSMASDANGPSHRN